MKSFSSQPSLSLRNHVHTKSEQHPPLLLPSSPRLLVQTPALHTLPRSYLTVNPLLPPPPPLPSIPLILSTSSTLKLTIPPSIYLSAFNFLLDLLVKSIIPLLISNGVSNDASLILTTLKYLPSFTPNNGSSPLQLWLLPGDYAGLSGFTIIRRDRTSPERGGAVAICLRTPFPSP